MVPGIIASFEPIDIESYDMESPELDANQVLREEFTAAGNIWGFGIFVRDPSYFGEPDSDVGMIAEYRGGHRYFYESGDSRSRCKVQSSKDAHMFKV